MILSRSHLVTVLSRFEAAMRRWRWDDDEPETADPVAGTAEREVQDILWLMLRPVFDDLVDEETLPKLGHSTYRADFGIPSLGILIEVKYVRKSSDFKEIEKQVIVDSIAYLKDTGRTKRSSSSSMTSPVSRSTTPTASTLLELDRISDVIMPRVQASFLRRRV